MKSLLPLFFFMTLVVFKSAAQRSMVSGPSNHVGRRMAILIGNSDYKGNELVNPGHDVDSMKVVLDRLGFVVRVYKDLTYGAMDKVIEVFANALSGDKTELVFFYFSGHGLALGDTNYLLPTDTRLNCLEQLKSFEDVALPHIVHKILDRKIQHNYFFIDACRDLPGLSYCNGNPAGVHALVKPQETHTGAVLSFATTAGKTADDNIYDKSNGLYTSELIKRMGTPDINIRQMLDLVKNGVFERSGRKQNPQIWPDVHKDYVLVGGGTVGGSDIRVTAFKMNSPEVDYMLTKKVVSELRLKYPNLNIDQAGSKSFGNAIRCSVKKKTVTGKNPVKIGNETYDLIKAETILTLTFNRGNEVIDEIELREGGTDYDKETAIQNSENAALQKLKNVEINLKK